MKNSLTKKQADVLNTIKENAVEWHAGFGTRVAEQFFVSATRVALDCKVCNALIDKGLIHIERNGRKGEVKITSLCP